MTINKLLFFIGLLITTISKAQTFGENYLGEDYIQYKGVLLKLKSEVFSGFSNKFYSDLKYCQSAYDNNVIYPEQKYFFNTTKDSLMNRIFIVENIIDKSGTSITNSDLAIETPIFILKDTSSKQIIYYKYDKKYEHDFPFNTSKITLDEKSICSKIERRVDDFTGTIKINSPIFISNDVQPMIIYKDINKTKTSYFLSLSSYGSTVSTNGTGATILFTDGTKWTRPVKIDVEVDKDGYEYSAFIALTAADLTTFMTKKINKYRLYIYDNIINPINADKFKIYVKCIKDSK